MGAPTIAIRECGIREGRNALPTLSLSVEAPSSGVCWSAELIRSMQIVYFSHSYRDADAGTVNYFARLLTSEGLILNLDPKSSSSVNSARLERLLVGTDG